MKISELITDLGRDFKDGFSISGEPLFSQYKKVYGNFISEDKGVLLIGSIGCGKSMMMKVFQRLFKDTDRKFKWVSSTDLKDLVDEGCSISEIKRMYGKDLKMDLYIDDIGLSLVSKQYGNCVNIISDLVFDRNELFNNEKYRTHFSSNMPTKADGNESLEGIYGKRVYDRIVEMCELISWNSKSLRSNGFN